MRKVLIIDTVLSPLIAKKGPYAALVTHYWNTTGYSRYSVCITIKG